MDRATAILVAWEYVAVALVATAGLRASRAGSLAAADGVSLFLGGVLLLAFTVRDHAFRDKREARAVQDSALWLAISGIVVAVATYGLLNAANVA